MSDTDTPSSQSLTRPRAASLTARAVAGGVSPLALLLTLPAPYATWAAIACAAFTGIGLAATSIPMPANQSGALWFMYRALNFAAMNWKYAANAAVLLGTARSPAEPSSSPPPVAGPGSVVVIPKETAK